MKIQDYKKVEKLLSIKDRIQTPLNLQNLATSINTDHVDSGIMIGMYYFRFKEYPQLKTMLSSFLLGCVGKYNDEIKDIDKQIEEI